jgi:thiol-disulfide isomerase/thioredoxin
MAVVRRTVLATIAVLAAFASVAAADDGRRASYTEDTFKSAVASGKPVLLEVSAPWCPTCRAQKAVLADLLGQADFADVMVVEVDFDSQKDVVRAFGAQMQSTLIVFKGQTETGRSVGETDPAAIEALLRTAL